MSEEEKNKLFEKCFYKTLKKLAEEPEEVINYNELLKKYNNLLKEKRNLQQKVEQLENIIKEAIEYNYKLQENYSHGALFEDKIAVNVYKVAEENLNILNKGSNNER